MVCYHPLEAWQHINGGKPVFSAPSNYAKYNHIHLPCGQCIGCRLDYSRQWAVRCVHEAQMHDNNCFLTLTYRSSDLKVTEFGEPTLHKRDFTLFMKRLRKFLGDKKVRFYMCGEYGDDNLRPHYHCILFGYDFPDKQLYKVNFNGEKLFISPTLEKLWRYGYCVIAEVNFETCAYVARYVMKKVTGDAKEEYYSGKVPEYVNMSRKPGIAREWFEKYKGDVFPSDEVVIRSNGRLRKLKPPRYYSNLYDVENPDAMEVIKENRIEKGKAKEEEIYNGRLADKEKVKRCVIKQLKRSV